MMAGRPPYKGPKRLLQCYNCGEWTRDHVARNCKNPRKDMSQWSSFPGSANLVVSRSLHVNHQLPALSRPQPGRVFLVPNKRFLDSGATSHHQRTSQGLKNFKETSNSAVETASGQQCKVTGIGDAVVNSKTGQIVLYNTKVTPDFDCDLVSVCQLDKENYTIIFRNGIAKIWPNQEVKICEQGQPILTANLDNGLYVCNEVYTALNKTSKALKCSSKLSGKRSSRDTSVRSRSGKQLVSSAKRSSRRGRTHGRTSRSISRRRSKSTYRKTKLNSSRSRFRIRKRSISGRTRPSRSRGRNHRMYDRRKSLTRSCNKFTGRKCKCSSTRGRSRSRKRSDGVPWNDKQSSRGASAGRSRNRRRPIPGAKCSSKKRRNSGNSHTDKSRSRRRSNSSDRKSKRSSTRESDRSRSSKRSTSSGRRRSRRGRRGAHQNRSGNRARKKCGDSRGSNRGHSSTRKSRVRARSQSASGDGGHSRSSSRRYSNQRSHDSSDVSRRLSNRRSNGGGSVASDRSLGRGRRGRRRRRGRKSRQSRSQSNGQQHAYRWIQQEESNIKQMGTIVNSSEGVSTEQPSHNIVNEQEDKSSASNNNSSDQTEQDDLLSLNSGLEREQFEQDEKDEIQVETDLSTSPERSGYQYAAPIQRRSEHVRQAPERIAYDVDWQQVVTRKTRPGGPIDCSKAGMVAQHLASEDSCGTRIMSNPPPYGRSRGGFGGRSCNSHEQANTEIGDGRGNCQCESSPTRTLTESLLRWPSVLRQATERGQGAVCSQAERGRSESRGETEDTVTVNLTENPNAVPLVQNRTSVAHRQLCRTENREPRTTRMNGILGDLCSHFNIVSKSKAIKLILRVPFRMDGELMDCAQLIEVPTMHISQVEPTGQVLLAVLGTNKEKFEEAEDVRYKTDAPMICIKKVEPDRGTDYEYLK